MKTRKLAVAAVAAAMCIGSNIAAQTQFTQAPMATLEKTFKQIPDSQKLAVYWYWMSDNISKEGVVKDLQAMKKVGINRVQIGCIGGQNVPYGKVKFYSDEWWEILHAALKTATELNIEVGIFNCPGWSQSGGPWIKPQQAMRYLASSRLEVTGGKKIKVKLPDVGKDAKDVKVIAFPDLAVESPLKAQQQIGSAATLDFHSDAPVTVRSITLQGKENTFLNHATLYAKEGNDYKG